MLIKAETVVVQVSHVLFCFIAAASLVVAAIILRFKFYCKFYCRCDPSLTVVHCGDCTDNPNDSLTKV